MGKDLLNDVNPVIDLEKKEIVYHLPRTFYLMAIAGVLSIFALVFVWVFANLDGVPAALIFVLTGLMNLLAVLYFYYMWRPVTLDRSGIHQDKQNWTWGEVDKCLVKAPTENVRLGRLTVRFTNGKTLQRFVSMNWQPEQIRDAVNAVAGKDICELEPAKGE